MMASQREMTGGDYVFIAVHPFAGGSEAYLRTTHEMHHMAWTHAWAGFHGEGEDNFMTFGSAEEMVKAYQGLFVLMPQVCVFTIVCNR